MVGKTAPIRQRDRDRFEAIKTYCGCLPCLLLGHLNRHTTIEHVTCRGRRIGRGPEQHQNSIGLCSWHHFAVCDEGKHKHEMIGNFGPSLALGRRPFEDWFGDELEVLVPIQNYVLKLFADEPWPEYSLPVKIAYRVRERWIEIANARS